MNRFSVFSAMIFIGLSVLAGAANAESPCATEKEALVGAWQSTSISCVKENGKHHQSAALPKKVTIQFGTSTRYGQPNGLINTFEKNFDGAIPPGANFTWVPGEILSGYSVMDGKCLLQYNGWSVQSFGEYAVSKNQNNLRISFSSDVSANTCPNGEAMEVKFIRSTPQCPSTPRKDSWKDLTCSGNTTEIGSVN
jgi:hypothetical protein